MKLPPNKFEIRRHPYTGGWVVLSPIGHFESVKTFGDALELLDEWIQQYQVRLIRQTRRGEAAHA